MRRCRFACVGALLLALLLTGCGKAGTAPEDGGADFSETEQVETPEAADALTVTEIAQVNEAFAPFMERENVSYVNSVCSFFTSSYERPEDLDLVVLENVGNLVCPAEFDTGAVKNAMILSVPEGHDKPLKYPLIFTVCDALIINKIDVLPYFDFDMDKVVEYAHRRNPNLKIFPISAKSGLGVDAWRQWLLEETRAWKES